MSHWSSDDAPDDAYERSEDRAVNTSATMPLAELLERRLARRSVLLGGLGLAGWAALGTRLASADPARFAFEELRHGVDHTHHVARDHDAEILIRWGDPVLPDAPTFDVNDQSATAQALQFGYNNDYVGYVPLSAGAPNASTHGLLCVNHEYTNARMMFPRSILGDEKALARRVDIEMAAHGGSVIEVRRHNHGNSDARWRVVVDRRYNRRITASTPMRLSGPAAGHPRMRTSADPSGTVVHGTLNNCAGGMTPWGTWLSAEENFHGYFWGPLTGLAEADNHRRYGVPGNWLPWGLVYERFDVARTPNEPNRFGWVVEIDPHDPSSVPVKRTALGRFKHEGAETVVNADGRLVVYMGDDQAFEYLYRFVSRNRVDTHDRAANRDLLDHGTLSVARFDEHGNVDWLALEHGRGPLHASNGFHSQADVLIETRRAADLLGATPLDRPEDVEPDARNGRVFVLLTSNKHRSVKTLDAVNSRPVNLSGQIVELTAPGGDHTAPRFRWQMLVRCGDPDEPRVGAAWNPRTSRSGWFAMPDNACVDHRGRLWIATDQGRNWHLTGTADGLWALETDGVARGTGRMFFRAPIGAEVCGPVFTPDDRSLFLAVQHPGTDGGQHLPGFGRRASFADPACRWPDFDPEMPPRPSVLAITRPDDGVIGA